MRVLALDYGSARCGCAVSDPTGTLATPIEHIERPGTRKGLVRVADLAREREVERIVVGLPLGLSGADTDQTRETRAWADKLRERVRPIPVELYDERFTTAIAAKSGDTRTSEDSRAAAVLLEDWLALHGGGQLWRRCSGARRAARPSRPGRAARPSARRRAWSASAAAPSARAGRCPSPRRRPTARATCTSRTCGRPRRGWSLSPSPRSRSRSPTSRTRRPSRSPTSP